MELNTLVREARGTVEHRATLARAIAIAVGVVTAAALLLGLLAGALGSGTTTTAAPAATPAAPPAVPSAVAPAAPGPAPAPVPSVARHTVAAGETLAALAQQYRVPVELLAADNGVADPDRIATGQSLAIAAPPANVVVITDGATLGGYATQYGTSVADLMALNPQITDADRILAGAGLRIAGS
jgi:N-acetylmuramoyl-L-alanine amidase